MISRAFIVLIATFLAASMDASANSPRKAALRDFNGDGRTDLLWQKDGGYAVWTMDGVSVPRAGVVANISGTVRFTADFDGDGKTDLLLRDPDGRHVVALMDGVAVRSSRVVAAANGDWEAIGVGDFDGDGRADIVWKNGAGDVKVDYMSGATIRETWSILAARPELSVAAVADFNGDGRSDILWSAADGAVYLGSFTGVGVADLRKLIDGGSGWWPAFVGDFNGDGHADIVWRHADGRHGVWYMDDPLNPQYASLIDANTGWSARFVRDLDGDGRSDLIWGHVDGSYAAWLMNGRTPRAYGVILNGGSAWSIIRSEDFDGDGRDDLLFRHADGSHAIWLMKGLQPKAYRLMFGGGTGWEAGPASEGCDRTAAGGFRIVNASGDTSRSHAYVERTPGTCGGAFIVNFTGAAATPGSAPVGPGTLSFADGEGGIKSVPVSAGYWAYTLTLTSAVGPAEASASGAYVLSSYPADDSCISYSSCATYMIGAYGSQIVSGTNEAYSLPPLKPGETIAASFTFQGGPGVVSTIAYGAATNIVAGPVADLEISISTQPGAFTATADTACNVRVPAASQYLGAVALYAGSSTLPMVCPLQYGKTYFINLRQVAADYSQGSVPSCMFANGCALRVQAN